MRNVTTITQFIQEMSFAVDHGCTYSINEVEKHILDEDLLDWLEQKLKTDGLPIDFSLFGQKERNYLHQEYSSMLQGYAGNERRKWGIENNGLCLLISWGIEIIRDLPEHRR